MLLYRALPNGRRSRRRVTLELPSEASAARGLKVHPPTVGAFLRVSAKVLKKTVLPGHYDYGWWAKLDA
jgi:hypothetical protein